MVRGTRSAQQVLAMARRQARRHGWSVVQIRGRGKGSHTVWAVMNETGEELGRIALTGHAGQMSQTVTRSNEAALEGLFGEGWLDK